MRLSCYDHEIRHNVVKVAADPRGDSRVDMQVTLAMLGRNPSSIPGQTQLKTDVDLVFLRQQIVKLSALAR